MKKLYAQIVLRLIRPALEADREARMEEALMELGPSPERTKVLNQLLARFFRATDKLGPEAGRQARIAAWEVLLHGAPMLWDRPSAEANAALSESQRYLADWSIKFPVLSSLLAERLVSMPDGGFRLYLPRMKPGVPTGKNHPVKDGLDSTADFLCEWAGRYLRQANALVKQIITAPDGGLFVHLPMYCRDCAEPQRTRQQRRDTSE